MNTVCLEFPFGLLKRKHGKQKAASFFGEYSSHERNSVNQEDWNLQRWPSNPDFLYS